MRRASQERTIVINYGIRHWIRTPFYPLKVDVGIADDFHIFLLGEKRTTAIALEDAAFAASPSWVTHRVSYLTPLESLGCRKPRSISDIWTGINRSVDSRITIDAILYPVSTGS
jgi:hypothetical protein